MKHKGRLVAAPERRFSNCDRDYIECAVSRGMLSIFMAPESAGADIVESAGGV